LGQAAQRQKLQQLLAGAGPTADAPEGRRLRLSVGPSEALHERRHALWRLIQDDGVHVSDIDAQLQGAGGNTQCLCLALKQTLDLLSLARFEVAVMQIGGLLQIAMLA